MFTNNLNYRKCCHCHFFNNPFFSFWYQFQNHRFCRSSALNLKKTCCLLYLVLAVRYILILLFFLYFELAVCYILSLSFLYLEIAVRYILKLPFVISWTCRSLHLSSFHLDFAVFYILNLPYVLSWTCLFYVLNLPFLYLEIAVRYILNLL